MIEKITSDIWLLTGKRKGRYPHSHSLYLRAGGGVLVDCGSNWSEIETLAEQEGIAAVLMSHYHEDHFLYLHRLPETEVWASLADAPALESMDALEDCARAGTNWARSFRRIMQKRFNYRPRPVARRIQHGENLSIGNLQVEAIVAPGHTPGHLCLHFPAEGILFLGDYDLTDFGPWYGDRRSSMEQFRTSGAMLADIGAKINVVSHQQAIHRGDIHQQMTTYLQHIDRREEALCAFLRRPRSKEEIIARRIVFGEQCRGAWFDYGEWALMSKHLEKLMQSGEVIELEGHYQCL